jgi:hypothetical protein
MAYRRKLNHRDAWAKTRDHLAPKLAALGLPAPAYASERTLVALLTDGVAPEVPFRLADLSERQLHDLSMLVSGWYDYDAVNFTALNRPAGQPPDDSTGR